MRTYFAPDTGDIPNWGCRVMGQLYRQHLTAAGFDLRWRTGSRFFAEPDASLPCPNTLPELLALAEPVRQGKLLPQLAAFMPEVDIAFMNGENFIRPGATKGRMLLAMAYLIQVVFARPVALVNLCLDLSEPALAEIAAHVLPRLSIVAVRDLDSLAALHRILPDQRARLIPDIAWTVTAADRSEWQPLGTRTGHWSAFPDQADGFDPSRDYITVCATSAYTRSGPNANQAVPAFVKLCRALQTLVPQVVLVAPCQIDALILRAVQAQTGLPLLGLNLPVQQGIDVLAHARLHVGGRWHPGIFAATGGTPLVGLAANSHKMHSLFKDIKRSELLFDPFDLDKQINAIISQCQDALTQGDTLRTAIASRAARLRREASAGLAELLGEIRAGSNVSRSQSIPQPMQAEVSSSLAR